MGPAISTARSWGITPSADGTQKEGPGRPPVESRLGLPVGEAEARAPCSCAAWCAAPCELPFKLCLAPLGWTLPKIMSA